MEDYSAEKLSEDNLLCKVSDTSPQQAVDKKVCIWLMGLSASGKTTLASLLGEVLVQRGLEVEILDGDKIRSTMNKGLGFSKAAREANLRRIAEVARLLILQGKMVVVAAICPYEGIRQEVRTLVGEFVEVFIDCPLEVCIERDPKGLYRKALAGEIKDFTGIGDPFETPQNPHVVVRTDQERPEDSLARILEYLEKVRGIPPAL